MSFLGLIPLLISIFLQRVGIYGPFKYLNGLIVFYLYPIDKLGGYAGLFNNPNYAGLGSQPLYHFVSLYLNTINAKTKLSLIISIIFLIIYGILLTNSRNSIAGIIISSYLMIGAKLLIICLLVSISIFLILALKPISFLGISFFEGFLPEEFITKILRLITLINYNFQE